MTVERETLGEGTPTGAEGVVTRRSVQTVRPTFRPDTLGIGIDREIHRLTHRLHIIEQA